MRETCEHKDRCGKSGHYLTAKGWTRCECLQRELLKSKLGVFDTPNPIRDTNLKSFLDRNTLIEGPINLIRKHMAGVVMHLADRGKTCKAMDAYRLIEIFLDKDDEFGTTMDLADFDLLTILLGFGDVKNQRLPDLIIQAIARREITQKATWMILGLPLGQVATKYNTEVYDKINPFARVLMK